MRKVILSASALCLLFIGPFSRSNPGHLYPLQEQHEVTVRLVLVDVVATDKDGNFVTDLSRDDFEIFEDGKKMTAESFELFSLGAKEEKPETKPARKKRLIVVFDSVNSIKRVIERSKPEILQRLLGLIQQGGEVMVLELSDREGMKVLQDFSSNSELISQAVNNATGNIWVEKSTDALAFPEMLERKDKDKVELDFSKYKETNVDIYQYFQRVRFEKTINGLLAVLNMARTFSGKKNILFISSGIPTISLERRYKEYHGQIKEIIQVSEALVLDPFEVLKKSGLRTSDEILKDLIQYANSHNITFNAMDPDNYLRYVLPDVAYETMPRIGFDVRIFSVDEADELKRTEMANINILAEDTGGSALKGASKFDRFEEVLARDLNYTYELSYSPPRKKADGKYHKIEVKVKKPDIEVHFRQGYYDYTDDQKESLLFSSASYNPSLFTEVEYEAQVIPFVHEKGEYSLWLNLALPVKKLILKNSEGLESKVFKLNLTIDDLSGDKTVSNIIPIPVIYTPVFREQIEKAEHLGLNFYFDKLNLKKSKYRVDLALYDPFLGEMGTLERNLEMPEVKNIRELQVINAVLGHLAKITRTQLSPFSISDKDGTLHLKSYKFHPLGVNQLRPLKNIALFLQLASPLKQENLKCAFSLYQDGREVWQLAAGMVEESWNKKASVWNALFVLDFSRLLPGNYDLKIFFADQSGSQVATKELPIKIL